jgi:uncharacterized membrane protein YfcA
MMLKDVLQQLKMQGRGKVIVFLGALCVLAGSSFLLAAVFSSDVVATYLFIFVGMFAIVIGLRTWVKLAGASEEEIDRTVKRLKFLAPWVGFTIAALTGAIFSLAWFGR